MMTRADDNKKLELPQPEVDPVLALAQALARTYRDRARRDRKGSLHLV